MTVSPYLGADSVAAYARYEDKGVFVLCRTSNPGAKDFQDLACRYREETLPLYQVVAARVEEWNTAGNLGLVVGATYPEELGIIRARHPALSFLVPGIGAQGGDLAKAVANGADGRGRGMVINSSRQVLYASNGKDFADAARRVAGKTRDDINLHLPAPSA
jgi:orotidine-5'-phosphate decarboxylase